MKAKLIGSFVCMIMIATTLPATGSINDILSAESNATQIKNIEQVLRTDYGEILAQDLNEDGQGYTVLRVWGSHYEMGYAYAQLLGEYIIQAHHNVKNLLGSEYDDIRDLMEVSIWRPPEIEDEIQGMVDALAISHPEEEIDGIDIRVWNCLGDWLYGMGCRAHTCWGRYVTDPIKTLATIRLDFDLFLPVMSHHVLCAHLPDNGSPMWASFDWPGYFVVVTAVNEYGTLIRLHDFASNSPDLMPNRMSRMIAARLATTFATDSDISTHVATVFSELQKYEIMTGTFLNYYAPEGHGGVMSCKPWYSGPDFYDLRRPVESWFFGEAMITTNQWTDGSYPPMDEDFGAIPYYNDETPKTLENHWNLLADNPQPPPIKILHMLSVGYRDRRQMTIWADGLINFTNNIRTPRLEYEWGDLFGASPDISIKSIKGGFGVSAVIENQGNADATDIDWSISFDKGFLLPKEITGSIAAIAAGDEVRIDESVFGLCKPSITICASCSEGMTDEKTVDCFVFLFLVLGIS